MTAIRVLPDAAALADAAARHIVELGQAAIDARGAFSIALSGGSTPRELHRRLANAPLVSQLDWGRVHLFFGDERCVPPDHPDSNYRMVKQSLLAHGLTATVHRVLGELPPEEAAAQYEEQLREEFGDGVPKFDLIILGLGPDGHTASLFPGSAALNDRTRWVAANYVEKFKSWRITFTYQLLNGTSEGLFLVSGAEKADAVGQALKGADLPSAKVRPAGKLLW